MKHIESLKRLEEPYIMRSNYNKCIHFKNNSTFVFQKKVKTSPVGHCDLVVENFSDEEDREKSGSESDEDRQKSRSESDEDCEKSGSESVEDLEKSASSDEKKVKSVPLETRDAVK